MKFKGTFLNKYCEEMTDILLKLNKDKTREEINDFVINTITNFDDVPDTVNNFTLSNQYIQDEEVPMTLMKLLNLYYNKKPIMTSYGVIYNQHEVAHNLNAEFVNYLMSERKVAKAKQFEGLNEGNKIKESFYEMLQKTMKLLNNSFYGVKCEKNSVFFNKLDGPSITYTGYSIITTSILAFEMFLSNNIKYDNVSDIIVLMNRIINKETNKPILKILDKDKIIGRKETYNRMIKLLEEPKQEDLDLIKIYIKNLNKEECNKIYYCNNFYKFLDNSKMKKYIQNILENKVIINPNKIDDETIIWRDELWELINDYVVYDYQIFNRAIRAYNLKRKSILGCDTDSNFLYLKPFYNWVDKTFGYKNYEGTDLDYTIANTAILFLSKYVQTALNRFTANCNIVKEKQPIINMKSELLYSRMMFTRNKKNYVGLLQSQEGNIINPPKIDMKGLAIKKASVNNRTREVFTNLIKEKVLHSKKIDIVDCLDTFIKFEEEIYHSLMNGEITFCTPGKCNDFESYKDVYRVQSARASLIWNVLVPENTIQTPAKVNVLKLNPDKIENIKDKFPEKYNAINNILLKSKIIKKYNENGEEYEEEQNKLCNYGLNIIALPKSLETIPDWIIPLIDTDTIIEDNIRIGNVILESLGIFLTTFDNKENYSTFITL